MLQRVAVRVPDHFFRSRIPCEIPFAGRIAPGAGRIPVPCLNEQFRVLTIADDAPSSFERLLELVWREECIRGVTRHPIDRRSQRIRRAELVHNVAWSGIHADRLRAGTTIEGTDEDAREQGCLNKARRAQMGSPGPAIHARRTVSPHLPISTSE